MFNVTIGEYILHCLPEGLPDLYSDYVKHAALAEDFNIRSSEGTNCFLAVSKGTQWPFLVVAQRYKPAGSGFYPGAILIPETDLLLIGAGARLLAYDLTGIKRVWEDVADMGFLSWAQHGNYVVMSAELELAAWDIQGKKAWTTFVEPPWDYSVRGGIVNLDVMGKQSSFPLKTGPDEGRLTRD
jgi:hypothetical protein